MANSSIGAWVRWARVLPMLAALLAAGCGSSTGEVNGVVTYNGEPLTSGNIAFVNEGTSNKDKIATTRIQSDGRYHLPQVACGDVQIAVRMLSPRTPGASSIKIPTHYGEAKESGLTYTVTPGTQTFDIKLSGPPASRKTGGKSLSPEEKLKKGKERMKEQQGNP